MIVPFAAGGTMDNLGRLVSAEMSKALGQPIVLENISGAGGVLGATVVVKSPPDGYTVCFCTTGATIILPILNPKLPYKMPDDLVPVGHVLRIEQAILVNASSGAPTLKALLDKGRQTAAASAKPVFYGTPGSGTSNHLAGELLKLVSHADLEAVHYRGEAPGLTDLLGGRLDFLVASVFLADPQVKAGRLRILALTGPSRVAHFPDIPTIAQSGYPGYEATTHVGLHVSRDTPRSVIDKLHAALATAMTSKQLQDALQTGGITPDVSTPDAYAAFMQQEKIKWTKVISTAGVKLE